MKLIYRENKGHKNVLKEVEFSFIPQLESKIAINGITYSVRECLINHETETVELFLEKDGVYY